MAPEQDVTALLVAWGQGDREADSRLMALVYDDLRRIAPAQFFAIAARLMRQILVDHARTP